MLEVGKSAAQWKLHRATFVKNTNASIDSSMGSKKNTAAFVPRASIMTHCRSWTCQCDSIPLRRHIVSPSQTTGRFVKKTPPEKVPHVDLSPLSFLSLIIDGSKEFQGLRELPGAAFFFIYFPPTCVPAFTERAKSPHFFLSVFHTPPRKKLKCLWSQVKRSASQGTLHFTLITLPFTACCPRSFTLGQRPPSIPTPTMSDYPCFNDCPVPSEDKWRNGADYSPTPRLHSRLDKWTFAIRKIGLCSPGLFIYSRGKESSWSSWHRGWAPSAQESACALYSSQHIKLFLQATSTSESSENITVVTFNCDRNQPIFLESLFY